MSKIVGQMKSNVKLFLAVLGLGLLLVVAASVFRRSPKVHTAPVGLLKMGATVPTELALESISGKQGDLGQYRGKVVLLNYWATWCGPCVHEMPSIYKIYDKWKSKGFDVIAVSMDSEPDSSGNFLKEKIGEAPFVIFRGEDKPISQIFALEGLPLSAIIDKNGIIRFLQLGEVDWNSVEMNHFIEGLM